MAEPGPVLLFADRLPPLTGGMEMHARYFMEHFHQHPRWPLLDVVTRNTRGEDCLLQHGERVPVPLEQLPGALTRPPAIVFFNSGRWIEDMDRIRALFPASRFVYRTGGNEIIKAPLERLRLPDHGQRQRWWGLTLARNLDLLITNSAFTEERLTALSLPRRLFRRCVGGVDADLARSLVQGFEPGARPPVLLCAARFVPYKNHDLLLRVLALVASSGLEFQLHLAGDGPLEDDLRRLVLELGLQERVCFLGLLDNEEVLRSLARSDLYIQLSTERHTAVPGGSYLHAEGMGRSVLEAITCGVPVIAVRAGALPEIVTAERGLLVELDSAERMASAIADYLALRPGRGPFTDRYAWQRIFTRYEKLWEGMDDEVPARH